LLARARWDFKVITRVKAIPTKPTANIKSETVSIEVAMTGSVFWPK
jgi:hypothetical protein